jgi:hypothetical protein
MNDNRYPFPHKFVRGNYREYYLMQGMSENDVVRDIVALLQSYKVDAAIIDAGGRRARGRLMAAAKTAGLELGKLAQLKTGGGIPKGFADIEATLAPDGRSLYIEVKQPLCLSACGKVRLEAGEPSREQLEFLREKQLRGALVMVAWAADDVEHHLETELKRNRRAVTNHGETTQIRRNLAGTR